MVLRTTGMSALMMLFISASILSKSACEIGVLNSKS